MGMIIPPPRPHTKLQKCNKASKIARQTHEHTRTHPLTYNIVQKLIVCSGIETTTAAQRHTNKNLHILTHQEKYSRIELFYRSKTTRLMLVRV